MLDAFCSSEFFRKTLDGARRMYLNGVSTKLPRLSRINTNSLRARDGMKPGGRKECVKLEFDV